MTSDLILSFLGKIPYFTLPPKRDAGVDSDAVIITEDGKEFNIDEIYKAESSYIGGLKSIEEFHHIEIPPNAPPGIDEEMLEVIILKLAFFRELSGFNMVTPVDFMPSCYLLVICFVPCDDQMHCIH